MDGPPARGTGFGRDWWSLLGRIPCSTRDDGRKGFLKALDYAKAFSQHKPVSIALQELTESINFEKYVLARCRDRRLDRIVISIADGTYIDGQPGVDTVEYLIFELADGDVRKHMKVVDKLDVHWRLKTLHHISTGLNQLHRNDIFHQDIKPSNILVSHPSPLQNC